MTAPAKPAPFVTVYDGRECLGFILSRGKLRFEALDREENSLGLFKSQREAAAALVEPEGVP
jgi:hypothetical protein